MKSISDLCDQIFEGTTPATPNEVVRLAAFISDHAEHKTFAGDKPKVEQLGMGVAKTGSLTERLAPMAPGFHATAATALPEQGQSGADPASQQTSLGYDPHQGSTNAAEDEHTA